jgi:hypothetical protein
MSAWFQDESFWQRSYLDSCRSAVKFGAVAPFAIHYFVVELLLLVLLGHGAIKIILWVWK